MPFKTLIVKDFDEGSFKWTGEITDGDIGFIVDEASRIIYVWNGNKASMIKKYKAGTFATKIKSLYQFYGFKTVVINQGEETGELLAEINKLLAGNGTLPSEDELESLKPTAAPEIDPRAQAVTSSRVKTPSTPVSTAPVAPPKVDESKVSMLEDELEKERKKSSHKLTKLREEMDTMKAELETKIAKLEGELEKASEKPDLGEKLAGKDKKIAELENQLKSLEKEAESQVKSVKADLNKAREKIVKLESEARGKPDIDEDMVNSLKSENEKLKSTVSSLQADISSLKQKLDNAESKSGDEGKAAKLEASLEKEKKASTAKIKELEKELSSLKETQESKINELKTKHEDAIAGMKEEISDLKRKIIEKEEALKEMGELTFAPIDAEDQGQDDGSGLSFVNPYSAGGVGAKVDPLKDLKSFLNTVDPSKPLDPELKNLLEVITQKMQDDNTIIESLKNIKKGTKDK
ncbi:hypothetical protein GF325_16175, partial [Candidatus Bathyarchaeota archaeon]|nr:hypothetical protein [Candidatus Bathyarchaeota archaeon]